MNKKCIQQQEKGEKQSIIAREEETQITEKRKIGRPTKYRKEMEEEVIEYGKKGYTMEMVAAALGINKDTLYVWIEEKPNFSDAIARMKGFQCAYWDNWGMQNMQSRDFNSRLFELYRCNMHGWQNKAKIEHSGEVSLSLSALTEGAN